MPLNVLVLRTEDGQHTLPCPPGTVLDVGSDPACEILLEGEGVFPHHCILRRMDERHFRITAIALAARFSVNGVLAADLGVDAPFEFGIAGETIQVDLLDDPKLGSPAGGELSEQQAEGAPSSTAEASAGRATRRDYLLQPASIRLRTGGRPVEVRVASPELLAVAPMLLSEAAAPAHGPRTETPDEPLPGAQSTDVSPQQRDEEESSPVLLAGLLVCVAMIAAILWWKHRLDAEENRPANGAAPGRSSLRGAASPVPVATPIRDSASLARWLRLAGMPDVAAHMLMPSAEAGDRDSLHELALSLHASGNYGEEVVLLLQQAAQAGSRGALADLVLAVEHEDYPGRYGPEALHILQQAAARGESTAWLPLGERYEHGHGMDPDLPRALEAFIQARAAGDQRAEAKLSAKDDAVRRVVELLRSWNQVSVADLLEHVSLTPGRFFGLEYPSLEAVLRHEEDFHASWPLRRVRAAEGATAELETFDIVKVTQPFSFEVENGNRIARGTGVLACTVRRDTTHGWRITDAADTITPVELLPGPEQFSATTSLRALRPALAPAELAEECRQEILREMHGLEDSQDFKAALAAVLHAAHEFPKEPWWRPLADSLCDRMARQLFSAGRWLDPAWAQQVHSLAEAGSISALLLEGHLLAAGYGCQRDEARSTSLYRQAFETSTRRDARFYYAEALFQGQGITQDMTRAGELVLPFMARSKHPLEAYLAAHLLWRKAETDPALWQQVYDALSHVAEKHPPARHLAAMVLLNHGNTTRERRTGFAALKAAAEAGVQEAMKNLAKCYQDGTGCEQDFQAATLWKQKAAITEPPRRKHYTEFAE